MYGIRMVIKSLLNYFFYISMLIWFSLICAICLQCITELMHRAVWPQPMLYCFLIKYILNMKTVDTFNTYCHRTIVDNFAQQQTKSEWPFDIDVSTPLTPLFSRSGSISQVSKLQYWRLNSLVLPRHFVLIGSTLSQIAHNADLVRR